ncbi:AAA family ATPase [Geotalea uraniireducens]|uniref:ATPase associated with various cellular activities, AAA_3 n=1 Tax=Geotalea uraniireducens (strain Rf4) TaxID=351605 RepID=A5GDE2_GEOUR|nr:MoxR family ATPase [Geotalea uraniireducens]ABQ24403.1 ATPase associated with various cellular activities, AAA_3 [Geotalea uraniireducens Rf4]
MPDPRIQKALRALSDNIEQVIVGKKEVIDLAIITLLCRGHLLIEDVPGLGKTMLARAIAGSLSLDFKRVQFTPDLLPSDVTGVSIYNQKSGEFDFRPGPVFTNLLLADEINRATPRTQSSLLESMEERQVTTDGTTRPLPPVFMVVATQNPIELQGTYPLPEAQLDRFFMRVSVGYPARNEEVRVMEMQIREHPIHGIKPVLTEEHVRFMQNAVTEAHIDRSLLAYIVDIVNATRKHPELQVGASPRGSLSLMRAAQAMVLLRGMEFVEPTVIKTLARHVLTHRLIVKPQARLKGLTEAKVVEEILQGIPAPV